MREILIEELKHLKESHKEALSIFIEEEWNITLMNKSEQETIHKLNEEYIEHHRSKIKELASLIKKYSE